jgi:hypothetical protein
MEKNINDYFDEFGKKRAIRKAARLERVKKRQEAKTKRGIKRQESRERRLEARTSGREARQAVRQKSKLDKVIKRRKVEADIDESAANNGNQDAANVAAGYLKSETGSGKMKAYIQNQGAEVPEGVSTEEMAAVAQGLREEEVQDTQEALNEGVPEAEQVTKDEAEQFCFDSSEFDGFDGDSFDYYDPTTAAAVMKAAGKGAELLKQRRQKQGKSTKFLEDVEKFLKPQTAAGEPTSDIGKVIDEGVDEYKKQTIKGYLPYIIVAVVIIILGTLYFKKK